ncbi:hypothetical protein Sjap_025726 [Stephania japonica]|uniref:Uncharacterized protein n=1 Tax=Stephania japonica TaxID=461633 RepID=A0AAP0E254_9MAGN
MGGGLVSNALLLLSLNVILVLTTFTENVVVSQEPSGIKRTLVAVQGVVYCKPCKYQDYDTLLEASPLQGAVVRLQCNNTKYPLSQEAKTDKNGYFLVQGAKRVTNYGAHKCKVFLGSSPLDSCSKATDLHHGMSGATLNYQKPPSDHSSTPALPFSLYTVGPFAFAPASCPQH